MSSKLDDAVTGLNTALDQLQAAIERRRLAGTRNDALESEVQTLNADRARLADRLDKAEARAARLESVNKDVSHRLVGAMETIRGVLSPGGGKA